MVLDGAMGTVIQQRGLGEDSFRGERFAAHPTALKGCNDVLCLTCPDVVADIHREYLEAGADIIETDSFNANAVSLAEYQLSPYAREIAREAARIARAEADRFTATDPSKPRFVAGSMGPSGVALSVDTSHTFDELAAAFRDQACGLIEGGAHLLLLETIFDTLNAKAAIYGIEQAFDICGRRLPLMLSATLTENGRLLSGQTPEAFLASVAHARPLSVGFNCGFGPEKLIPFVDRLAAVSPYFVSLYPNAGLPDECGHYHTSPENLAAALEKLLASGTVNIIGGCCGTTPAHIRALVSAVAHGVPRSEREYPAQLVLSGLSPVTFGEGFVRVGERCNVAGSRKFLRLIKERAHAEALDIAAAQIDRGAEVIDVNMDDGLIDARTDMDAFVNLLGTDSRTAPVPVMVDSSDPEVLFSALRHIQGRPAVNSISLKNGEEEFIARATEIRRLGGAVVVMAFDEQGQADTLERRIEVCSRAYDILTKRCGFLGHEIIFDPNILAVATGIPAHDRYALDYLDTVSWIKANLPGALVSGGVSNLSFAFRGNNTVREAMHSAFLVHAIVRGLDMAIVNPSVRLSVDGINPELLEAVEDVLLYRRPDATDRLVSIASALKEAETPAPKAPVVKAAQASPADTLRRLVENGLDFDPDVVMTPVLKSEGSAMKVIDNVLMKAINAVGDRFAAGELFLPQVVRAAASMKLAVAWLTPYIEEEKKSGAGKDSSLRFVLATVKGDVHDIGKNIVAIVLRCAGFDVTDLGVMVPAKEIVDTAERIGAQFIGLSGLITPSLNEMANVAAEMESRSMSIPLFIGGATTSDMSAAVCIAPKYSGPVVHTTDAASLPAAATAMAPGPDYDEAARRARARSENLRENFRTPSTLLSLDEARSRAVAVDCPAPAPLSVGLHDMKFTAAELRPVINFRAFLNEWGIKPSEAHSARAKELIKAAETMLDELADIRISARVILEGAHREGDDIVLGDGNLIIPTLRDQVPNQATGCTTALSDFLATDGDHIGLFAVTVAGSGIEKLIASADAAGDEFRSLMLQILAHRLAEAATAQMHTVVRKSLWPMPADCGIRPAVGYPSLRDQSLVKLLDSKLHYAELGIRPTYNGALWPSATTTGLIIGHPAARYFSVNNIDKTQLADYAGRRRLSPEALAPFLGNITI